MPERFSRGVSSCYTVLWGIIRRDKKEKKERIEERRGQSCKNHMFGG
jgi:hypothetical protein